jgi:hypothetical protein
MGGGGQENVLKTDQIHILHPFSDAIFPLAAFKNCAKKSYWKNFSTYTRPFLHPTNRLMTFVLFDDLLKNLDFERDFSNIIDNLLHKAKEYQQADNIEEANSNYYEVYFWSGKDKIKIPEEKQQHAKRYFCFYSDLKF